MQFKYDMVNIMKMLPYTPDFPQLIQIPAASYAATLELDGKERDEVFAHLLVMDILVKLAVEQAGARLGFRAPENIFVEDVADQLGYEPGSHIGTEDAAIIDKATTMLRGEMETSPIWGTDSEAA